MCGLFCDVDLGFAVKTALTDPCVAIRARHGERFCTL
jgi:hypothetical protein